MVEPNTDVEQYDDTICPDIKLEGTNPILVSLEQGYRSCKSIFLDNKRL